MCAGSLLEVRWAEDVGEVVVGVRRVECRDEIGEGASRAYLAEGSKGTVARQVNLWHHH